MIGQEIFTKILLGFFRHKTIVVFYSMKKITTTVALFLTLSFILISFPEIGLVKAQSTIYIRPDGSIDGTDNILRNGNIYTLTGNISGGIQVQKSNILLDGVGYTVQGNRDVTMRGIDLSNDRGSDPSRPEISNVTVKNLRIINFNHGIENVNTDNNTIIGNYIADCDIGINIWGNPNNVLIKYNTLSNNINGISIVHSGGNQTIIENNLVNDIVLSNNVIIVWLSPQPIVNMNYWSDYNGTDNDGDGIGDSPYLYLNVDYAKYRDNQPLMEPVPIIPEFPSWTPLLIMLVAIMVIGVIYKRRLKL